MKITVKKSVGMKSQRIDLMRLKAQASQIFADEVKPQIELAKKTAMPNSKITCNNHI